MRKIITFAFVFIISLFFDTYNCLAGEVGSQLKNNNISEESKLSNIKNNNSKKNDILNDSYKDIFGDEQAFPFVAGLGKNAAH